MKTDLKLPERTAKPRLTGYTMVIDTGLPHRYFEDAISGVAPLVDLVKFGWGTALVTEDFERKTAVLRNLNVKYCFGGTLFEKFLTQDRVDSFLDLCRTYSMPVIEISNGTIPLSNTSKAEYIRKFVSEFEVVSEVGSKDMELSDDFSSAQWIDAIGEDLEAGAGMVITEARESGRAGICDANGELRTDILDDILKSGINIDQVLFEAPNKTLQTYLVSRLGANVNLGNIALDDVIALETLRLGLRSDTLFAFEK